MLEGTELEELWFERGPVRLHAMAAGPSNGPLVILLHGFPEFWYGWHRQIGPLSRAGFRVVVPDQRGYNLSSKPADIRDYAMSELTADVLTVADQLGAEQFYLAGHDWGAAVAWVTAIQQPQRVRKLVILNVPHPAVMLRNVRSDPRQMLRSWYIGFFQIPWVPESLFSANGFASGISALKSTSLPGTFTEEDFGRYRAAWSRPGAVTAMINWYRAFLQQKPRIGNPQIHVPTRILWGKRDRFLLAEMAEDSLKFCDSAELTYFPDNTHWLQHEQPEAVSAALVEFFRLTAPSGGQ
jgi:pimeloyl-ACP methyl ester carboxylesterase